MLSLGIETSCDETSAAVVLDGRFVLSSIVASSLKFHREYKGIIPEIASRAHVEYISLVVSGALKKASKKLSDIDLICVTEGPGLIGSLLVGVTFAKAISFALNKPIIGVNHLEAHLYAAFLSKKNNAEVISMKPSMPFVGLVVSGGHTSLFLVRKKTGSFRSGDRSNILLGGRTKIKTRGGLNFRLIGSTLDDAAGEAFDKVARILDLGYPGGPVIEKAACSGDAKKAKFACSGGGDLGFSFSGIKTAVLYFAQRLANGSPVNQLKSKQAKDIAAGFQEAVVGVLIKKSLSACRLNRVKTLVIGGGVAANTYLRQRFQEEGARENIKVYFPQAGLSLDNAAMIAGLGYQLFRIGKRSSSYLTASATSIRKS